jgi:hypothetical protein
MLHRLHEGTKGLVGLTAMELFDGQIVSSGADND